MRSKNRIRLVSVIGREVLADGGDKVSRLV